MTGTRMTFRQGQALARFVHELRPDWDVPGIENALGQVHDKAPADVIACAAIRAATTATNRTPAVIALDGPHWRPTHDTPHPHFEPPTAAERCSICSQRQDRCQSLNRDDHAFLSAAEARRRKGDAQQAKAITDALRAEIQPTRETTEAERPASTNPHAAAARAAIQHEEPQ